MLSAMTRVKALIVVAGALAAMTSTALPAATAAGSNPWTKIGTVHDNFNQPGLAVGSSGGLHAVWVRDGSSNTQDLVHTLVSLGGAVGASDPVQTGWASMEAVPDLISTGDGLRAFWGGIRTTDAGETNANVSTASAPAAGSPWTLQTGDVTEGPAGYASSIGAGLGSAGTPLFTWAGTPGVYVHAGLDPSTTDYNLQTQLGGCCGYFPDVAYDPSSDAAWVVWGSNATDRVGLYAQKVNATTGAPMGSAVRLPQSAASYAGTVSFIQQITRTPVVAGAHAAYVAYTGGYPSSNRVLLWKLSSAGVSSPIVVASGGTYRTPGIGVDSIGRVWVAWTSDGAVRARRSNPTVTKFGATVSVTKQPVGGCQTVYELTTAAAPSRLHVLGTYACTNGLGLYYAQLFPGLRITASPDHFRGKEKVTFTVSDAGVPVKGATVSAGGKSDTTDAHGEATIVLGPVDHKTRIVATATHQFYVKGRTAVVVRPR
jgi:hypothetical protein